MTKGVILPTHPRENPDPMDEELGVILFSAETTGEQIALAFVEHPAAIGRNLHGKRKSEPADLGRCQLACASHAVRHDRPRTGASLCGDKKTACQPMIPGPVVHRSSSLRVVICRCQAFISSARTGRGRTSFAVQLVGRPVSASTRSFKTRHSAP